MRLLKVSSYFDLSVQAAAIVSQAIRARPKLTLGLATGSTPLGLYRELIKKFQARAIDFSRVVTFNLDEYVGLPADHPQSYRRFMQENLFSKININSKNINFLNGCAADLTLECQRYEAAIAAVGGIDLQILGVGGNGHIGFNEPGSAIDSRTRVVALKSTTLRANARFFDSLDQVPKKALTMGIATILAAKKIVLLAGKNKQAIIQRARNTKSNIQIPASLIKNHLDCTWIVEQ